jgi:CMP-N,N'-diacetyllegionaminic acid synthase
MNVAIIPARGGSKGLPRKNIKSFAGHPLISWSIRQALACSIIQSVWVTSDSDEILDLATSYGAKPIKRPDHLASDTSSSESAWIHAVDHIEKTVGPIEYVFGLQPTSPLRESQDFSKALEHLIADKYDSLFSSVQIEDYFLWRKNPTGELVGINHDPMNRKRRQNIEIQYLENGSFYIFRPANLRLNGNRLYGRIGTYKMEGYKRFQIDSLEDFILCEAIMKGYGLDKI